MAAGLDACLDTCTWLLCCTLELLEVMGKGLMSGVCQERPEPGYKVQRFEKMGTTVLFKPAGSVLAETSSHSYAEMKPCYSVHCPTHQVKWVFVIEHETHLKAFCLLGVFLLECWKKSHSFAWFPKLTLVCFCLYLIHKMILFLCILCNKAKIKP